MRPKEFLNDKRIEAEKLWQQGKQPVAHIAKQIGIDRRTVQRWAKEGNWHQKRDQINQKVREDMLIDVAEEKERTLKLCHAIEAKYSQELVESDGLPKSTGHFAAIQKVKWDLLQPRTETQFNFMKQNNINMAIKPEEAKRAIEALHEYERRIKKSKSDQPVQYSI